MTPKPSRKRHPGTQGAGLAKQATARLVPRKSQERTAEERRVQVDWEDRQVRCAALETRLDAWSGKPKTTRTRYPTRYITRHPKFAEQPQRYANAFVYCDGKRCPPHIARAAGLTRFEFRPYVPQTAENELSNLNYI